MIEEDRGAVRAVAWSELFPWLLLFRCFRLSIGFRPLVLSSAAAVAMVLGWWLIGLVFSGNEVIASQHEAYNGCPWNSLAAEVDAPVWPFPGPDVPDEAFGATANSAASRSTIPTTGTWEHLCRPFREVFTLNVGAGRTFRASNVAYSLLCGLWALAVWSLSGGAVTRDAAVQLAARERIGWADMIGYAKRRWRAYLWAPLLPFLGVLLAAVGLAVFGILLRLNLGVFLAGLVWPLVLAGGFLMTLLLFGVAFGWPLMFATISTEGKDSFDAISRSYAYTFQRPLHYLFYLWVVTVLGMLGWVFVYAFAQSLLAITHGAICWGSGGQFAFVSDPMPHLVYHFANGEPVRHVGWLGDFLIRFWSDCVRLLAVGYLYSYFWVSASAIYLLLRRDVDDTELDEVHLDDLEEDESLGLPEISSDESGAPVVDDNGDKPLSEME